MIRFLYLTLCVLLYTTTFAQNVGVNTLTPLSTLHLKGVENVTHLTLDADTIQSNNNPFIKLRTGMGSDLLWIHADDSTNTFIGLKAGLANIVGPQGVNNTFLGSRSGYSNTNGRDNTAIGTNALFSNTKASWNIAIGKNALYTQSFDAGSTVAGIATMWPWDMKPYTPTDRLKCQMQSAIQLSEHLP